MTIKIHVEVPPYPSSLTETNLDLHQRGWLSFWESKARQADSPLFLPGIYFTKAVQSRWEHNNVDFPGLSMDSKTGGFIYKAAFESRGAGLPLGRHLLSPLELICSSWIKSMEQQGPTWSSRCGMSNLLHTVIRWCQHFSLLNLYLH